MAPRESEFDKLFQSEMERLGYEYEEVEVDDAGAVDDVNMNDADDVNLNDTSVDDVLKNTDDEFDWDE